MKIAAINEIPLASHGRMQLSLAHLRNENKSVFDPQQSIHLSSQTLGASARNALGGRPTAGCMVLLLKSPWLISL
jgi:hypothetical protein